MITEVITKLFKYSVAPTTLLHGHIHADMSVTQYDTYTTNAENLHSKP